MPPRYKRKRGSTPSYTGTKKRRVGGNNYKFKSRRKFKRKNTSYYKRKTSVKLSRFAKFSTPRKPPVLRGTSHRIEFSATAETSTALAHNQNLLTTVTALSQEDFFSYGLDTGNHWQAGFHYTDYDAYEFTFPKGMRKIYHVGTKLSLRFTCIGETNCTIRTAVVRKKQDYPLLDWNHDVHRTINTRHLKVLAKEKFVLSSTNGNGEPMIKKEYWFPVNRWIQTKHGDPATSYTAWDNTKNDRYVARYLWIDSDDYSNVDTQKVRIDANVTIYFHTVNDNES